MSKSCLFFFSATVRINATYLWMKKDNDNVRNHPKIIKSDIGINVRLLEEKEEQTKEI